MVWVILFVVVAMVLAPVMWMMPSPAQKRQAVMRERARKLGLMVNIVDLPQSHRAKVRREPAVQGVSYSLRIARQKGVQRPCWFIWREQPADEPQAAAAVPAVLIDEIQSLRDMMPADMVGLESNEAGYSAYWREQGDSAVVDQIAELLGRVRLLAGGKLLGS